MIRRREFITGFAGAAAAWPCVVRAQHATKHYRIGMLETTSPTSNAANLNAFRQRLQRLGYVEGRNLVIDYRSAEGRPDRFPALATELVNLKADLITTRERRRLWLRRAPLARFRWSWQRLAGRYGRRRQRAPSPAHPHAQGTPAPRRRASAQEQHRRQGRMRDTLLTNEMCQCIPAALAWRNQNKRGATRQSGRHFPKCCIEALRCELQDAGLRRDGEAIDLNGGKIGDAAVRDGDALWRPCGA